MKLILKTGKAIEFSSSSDLEKSIPEGLSGNALNYGQGEGQVRILSTVWGFYCNSGGGYYMQLEEGVETADFIFGLARSIAQTLASKFETRVELLSAGIFEDEMETLPAQPGLTDVGRQ